MRTFLTLIFTLLTPLLASGALAQQPNSGSSPQSLKDRNFEIRLGAAWVAFDEAVNVSAAGTKIPNTDYDINENYSLLTEFTWFYNSDWSLAFASGIPPTTNIWGKKSLASQGKLTRTTYGPIVVAARRHFYWENGFSPYIGGGLAYAIFFTSKDSEFLKNVEIDNHFGPALNIGIDYPLTDKLTAFIDYKQLFISTDVHFDLATPLGKIPSKADARLNPAITTIGLSFRF